MTVERPIPQTRRALREGAASESDRLDTAPDPLDADPAAVPAMVASAALPAESVTVVIPPESPALGWVDETLVVARAAQTPQLDTGTPAYVPVTADLLARAPRRSPLRPGVLVPFGVFVLVIAMYCATTLFWPLYAVAPAVADIYVEPVPAAAAAEPWPATGSAAVAVEGVAAPAASSGDVVPIASITKLVTALLVLDQMPLAPGEQGRDYQFTSADRTDFRNYRARGESSLDVPVGGSLTEYQMLQGMLIGSANNYAKRLATTIWPTDAVFAQAANDWLAQHGLSGITIADPTGINAGNTASAEALIALADRALENPVIAEIVRTPSVELPGAGVVTNSNPLLADPGVIGLKTGTLDEYNLLAAKEVAIGDTTVRMYAAALGQPDRDTRNAATRALFAQLEQELQLRPSVAAGTVVGQVQTKWGDAVPIITAGDADVVLWNGAAATVSSTFDLGDHRDDGDVVGTLDAVGPLDSTAVDLVLDGEIDEPSPWWRLTNPLQLFGLV
ncbi:D-alanyl-D-alanine carboxypeptidase family protein [Microbacterium sp. cx-59]|uniref:D-alanyl-D-alanine carboxypeptidase family protein n=1 Tax=Microbacterium sp. cx-59 TaxID=2891207 RepID=UPI001E3E66EA|nr:D-alanyl-D-alanine carboxypeptidase [Microbacterium sp. cx-59]MCC4909323.1 D-alanyl-D-alanine carboxypeptidase [Microbacterium sp. cx-59]